MQQSEFTQNTFYVVVSEYETSDLWHKKWQRRTLYSEYQPEEAWRSQYIEIHHWVSTTDPWLSQDSDIHCGIVEQPTGNEAPFIMQWFSQLD